MTPKCPNNQSGKQKNGRTGDRGHSSIPKNPELQLENTKFVNSQTISEKTELIKTNSISTQTYLPDLNHKFTSAKKPNQKIFKCRLHYKKRRHFRKVLDSTFISGPDDRPFAKVKVFDEYLAGLLDSGANVSVLGKSCLEFLQKIKVSYRPIKSSVRTADNSKQNVIGFCTLPI